MQKIFSSVRCGIFLCQALIMVRSIVAGGAIAQRSRYKGGHQHEDQFAQWRGLKAQRWARRLQQKRWFLDDTTAINIQNISSNSSANSAQGIQPLAPLPATIQQQQQTPDNPQLAKRTDWVNLPLCRLQKRPLPGFPPPVRSGTLRKAKLEQMSRQPKPVQIPDAAILTVQRINPITMPPPWKTRAIPSTTTPATKTSTTTEPQTKSTTTIELVGSTMTTTMPQPVPTSQSTTISVMETRQPSPEQQQESQIVSANAAGRTDIIDETAFRQALEDPNGIVSMQYREESQLPSQSARQDREQTDQLYFQASAKQAGGSNENSSSSATPSPTNPSQLFSPKPDNPQNLPGDPSISQLTYPGYPELPVEQDSSSQSQPQRTMPIIPGQQAFEVKLPDFGFPEYNGQMKLWFPVAEARRSYRRSLRF